METLDKHILKVSNLIVELPNQTVLENVSFALEKGKTLAIIGPNGCDGKSGQVSRSSAETLPKVKNALYLRRVCTEKSS
jgi:ABC-type Mn2+/Zn2+ transport system ATPase subunit